VECPCFISRRTILPPIRPKPIMPSCICILYCRLSMI
jgi:hypothetical protein